MRNLNEHKLHAEIQALESLPDGIENRMYRVYGRYYSATSESRFKQDLSNKTHVLLLFDETGEVRGFTTLARYFHTVETAGSSTGKDIQVVFSGDTIIEHDYWGTQVLPMAWIEQTGRFKSEHPELPLYWFLIVKGYRTYRYLSVFSKEYYPAVETTEHAELQRILTELSIKRFGDAYQPDSGCIVFPESQGHLSGNWATIPERVRSKPDVAFFLKKNPGFNLGHELACITELSQENLTRRARAAFERGLS